MINGKTALFGVVIAVVAGVFGANVVQIHNDSQQPLTNGLTAGYSILGHITVVAKDAHGHIIAYRQTDNQIVNPGLNCMAVALFRTNTYLAGTGGTGTSDIDSCGGIGLTGAGTVTAPFNTASGFRWIQIGSSTALTGGEGATAQTQAALVGVLADTTGASSATQDQAGALVFTPAGTGQSNTYPTVSISATGFTVGGTTNTIGEAGLFDNAYVSSATTWPNMFARQTFATITMGTGDTLAVTWTITLQP